MLGDSQAPNRDLKVCISHLPSLLMGSGNPRAQHGPVPGMTLSPGAEKLDCDQGSLPLTLWALSQAFSTPALGFPIGWASSATQKGGKGMQVRRSSALRDTTPSPLPPPPPRLLLLFLPFPSSLLPPLLIPLSFFFLLEKSPCIPS